MEQWGFLSFSGDKIKNGSYVQNLLAARLLPAPLAVIEVPEHSKSDFWKPKEMTSPIFLQKNATLLEIYKPNLYHGPEGYSPCEDLRALVRKVQQLASERKTELEV